jgi:thiamine transport system permease protein
MLHATLITISLGLLAAALALALAYLMLNPIRRAQIKGLRHRRLILEWLSTHTLVAPAMVLSVGLFIFLLPKMDLDRWGILFVVLLNMAVVIPFAIHQLKPRLFQFDRQYHRLALSLKLTELRRWHIEWPFVRSAFLSTFALALVLAMGDVAIFSIFGNQDWTTLPWLIYSYASTYRLGEASTASLILLLLCALIVGLFERTRNHAEY